MKEKTYLTCVISGKPADSLPFGFDEEHPGCVALKLKLSEKITNLSAGGLTEFLTAANVSRVFRV